MYKQELLKSIKEKLQVLNTCLQIAELSIKQ